MQAIYSRWRRLTRPVSRQVFFFVTAMILPVALLVCVCKAIKYFQLIKVWNILDALLTLRSDFFFFTVVFLIYLVWLEKTRGWLHLLGRLSLHILVLGWMVLAAVEHGFFATTGSVGDWYLLKYALTQYSIMAKLIVGKMPWSALLLLSLVLVHLFPYTLGHIHPIRRWRFDKPSTRFVDRLWLRAIALCFLGMPLLLPYRFFDKGELRFLNQNVFVRVADQIIDGRRKQKRRKDLANRTKYPPFFQTRHLRLERTKKTRPHNVVVVILESIRGSATSLYPPHYKTTPYLAKVAKKGLLVNSMYPVIPHTSKALVSILCGIPPKITMPIVEGRHNGIPGRCIPKLMNRLDYKTAFFSSATNRFESRQQLLVNMGFKHIRTYENLSTKGFDKTNDFGYEDDMLLAPSLRWVDKMLAKKKPFFLSYLTLVSHVEYNTPRRFKMKRYSKRRDREFHKYLNAVRYTDQFVEKLMAGFKKRGLYKNTLFVFLSDHGEGFSEHYKRQHDNSLFQEVAQTAAVLYGPKVLKRTGRIKGIRQQFDLLPTIADVLGLKVTGGMIPGISLLKPVPANRRLFMSCWYRGFCMAMREGSKKYIMNYNRSKPLLFDIVKDPLERKNLAKNPHHPMITRASRLMKSWKQRIKLDYETSAMSLLKGNVSRFPFKVKTPVNIRFGKMLEFVGFTLHNKTKVVGHMGIVDITFVFRPLRRVPRSWHFFFHNHAPVRKGYQNVGHDPFHGAHPLRRWKARHYIRYRYRMGMKWHYYKGTTVKLTIGMWARGMGRAKMYSTKTGKRLKIKKNKYHYLTIKIR